VSVLSRPVTKRIDPLSSLLISSQCPFEKRFTTPLLLVPATELKRSPYTHPAISTLSSHTHESEPPLEEGEEPVAATSSAASHHAALCREYGAGAAGDGGAGGGAGGDVCVWAQSQQSVASVMLSQVHVCPLTGVPVPVKPPSRPGAGMVDLVTAPVQS
jgi:hypothetical protein